MLNQPQPTALPVEYDAAPATFGDRTAPRYAGRMAGSILEWSTTQRADSLVLAPRGRVDEATADEFRNHLVAAIETGPKCAVIDLDQIAYMSSRGLRALTLAQRAGEAAGTTIVLARPNDTMREILAISRYDMVFRVADTVEEALGH